MNRLKSLTACKNPLPDHVKYIRIHCFYTGKYAYVLPQVKNW